jgi:ABC-type transport system involved in cytochrome c biogenesis permease subunit
MKQPPDPTHVWLLLHIPLLFFAYLLLAGASALGVGFLVQEHLLKSHRPSALSVRGPSLEVMERWIYRLILAAFPLLAIGILLGCFWGLEAWGRFWGWDPKETFSLVTLAVYALCLALRWKAGWRGRKSTYVALGGFVLVVFTWIAVRHFSPLHPY